MQISTSSLFRICREFRQLQTTEQITESTEGKMLPPNFVKVCSDRDVGEGKMTRFECRVTGRPYPDVTWFINGRRVVDDATHKILVNESGNHALMITSVSRNDSGVVTCVAQNKSGETSFQVMDHVICVLLWLLGRLIATTILWWVDCDRDHMIAWLWPQSHYGLIVITWLANCDYCYQIDWFWPKFFFSVIDGDHDYLMS